MSKHGIEWVNIVTKELLNKKKKNLSTNLPKVKGPKKINIQQGEKKKQS